MNTPDWQSLSTFLRPASIAVIGASSDLSRYPGKVTRNLSRFGYAGRVYAVNPNYKEIQGYPCYPSIADVPEPVDVALLLVAAKHTPDILRQAVAAGCRSVVIYASGMAEASADGAALQAEMLAIAREGGVRMLGPNCLGCVSVVHGTALSGAGALARDLILGGIGIAAQSGGVMGSIVDRAMAHGIGISHAIATGNEADVSLADCVGYMAEDPATRVIALFLEAIRDVPRFRAACELAAERGKPVVVLKTGRSERGRHLALSHTASLLSEDGGYDALFKRLGVIRVNEFDDLFLTPNLMANSPAPKGRGVAVACASGGLAGLSADICDELGLTLADIAPATLDKIRKLQAGFGDAYNPLDITGQVVSKDNWWTVKHMQELLLADPSVDVLVFGQSAGQFADEAASDLISLNETSSKPVISLWTGRHVIAAALARLREKNIPVFEQPSACFRAIDAAIRHAEFRRRHEQYAQSVKPVVDAARRGRVAALLAANPGGLSEHDGKTLLSLYGIRCPAEALVTNAGDAVAAAARIGYPVVVKAHGAQLQHKSEIGGVILNRRSADEVAEAYRAVTRAGKTAEALIAGMAAPGPEFIVGLSRDPQIGLMLVVGSGGIFVEVANDAVTRLAPLWPGEAEEMLASLRGAKLLDGLRGQPKCDREAVIRTIEAVSLLAFEAGDLIEQLDINPVIAGPAGAFAVDALIIPRAT